MSNSGGRFICLVFLSWRAAGTMAHDEYNKPQMYPNSTIGQYGQRGFAHPTPLQNQYYTPNRTQIYPHTPLQNQYYTPKGTQIYPPTSENIMEKLDRVLDAIANINSLTSTVTEMKSLMVHQYSVQNRLIKFQKKRIQVVINKITNVHQDLSVKLDKEMDKLVTARQLDAERCCNPCEGPSERQHGGLYSEGRRSEATNDFTDIFQEYHGMFT